MDIQDLYFNMTQVDLAQQRRIWDDRGKGYYGEFCVFKELFTKIEDNCKFLMNLHIPISNGQTTEIDLIMLHPTGLYVFEIKHYKGTIYGNVDDEKWTQFFRTTKNSVFDSPIQQNAYHLRALERLFPNLPLHSFIVFSNDACDVKVTNYNPHLVITSLSNLISDFQSYASRHNSSFDITSIDQMFSKLQPYSSSKDISISEDAEVIPFHQYLNQLRLAHKHSVEDAQKKFDVAEQRMQSKLQTAINNANQKASNFAKHEASKKRRWWLTILCVVIILVAISASVCKSYIEKADLAEAKLQEMIKNFEHVDVFNGGHLDFKGDFIDVTEVKLENSSDLDNTAVFSCKLTNTGKEYGILFNKNTKYIVMLDDGTIQEYDMFGKRLQYNSTSQRLGGSASKAWYKQSAELLPLEIYNISDISKITYIKLTNISIWKYGENSNKSIADGYQIQVYSK